MNKVLIADNVSDAVFGVFEKYKIEYEQKVGMSEDEICSEIGSFIVVYYFDLYSYN